MGEEADSVEGGIGATPVDQAPVLDGSSVKVSGGGREMDGRDLNDAAKAADAGADPFKEFMQSEAGQRVDGWLRTLADVQTLQGSIQGVMNGHPEQLFNVLRSVVNLDSRLLDGKILKTASSIISGRKPGKKAKGEGEEVGGGDDVAMEDTGGLAEDGTTTMMNAAGTEAAEDVASVGLEAAEDVAGLGSGEVLEATGVNEAITHTAGALLTEVGHHEITSGVPASERKSETVSLPA